MPAPSRTTPRACVARSPLSLLDLLLVAAVLGAPAQTRVRTCPPVPPSALLVPPPPRAQAQHPPLLSARTRSPSPARPKMASYHYLCVRAACARVRVSPRATLISPAAPPPPARRPTAVRPSPRLRARVFRRPLARARAGLSTLLSVRAAAVVACGSAAASPRCPATPRLARRRRRRRRLRRRHGRGQVVPAAAVYGQAVPAGARPDHRRRVWRAHGQDRRQEH